MSDLFGGGMSSSSGGVSRAERRLDKITLVISIVWVLTIIATLFVYRAESL